ILSSIAQLFLFYSPYNLFHLGTIVEIFFTEFSKLGIQGAGLIYIFYPLYPELTFKVEGLILTLAEHFFGIKYKPNEYSLRSYKISTQIHMINVVLFLHRIYYFLKISLLRLNIGL